MKFLCVLLLSLLLHNVAYTQTKDWKIIGSGEYFSVEPIFVSEDGLIFGICKGYDGKIFVSDLNNQTWIKIFDDYKSLQLYNEVESPFTEKNGNIYFFNQTEIFTFQKDIKQLKKIVTLTVEILDLVVLDNEQFLVAHYKGMSIFDKTGIIKENVSLPNENSVIIEDALTDTKYFLYSKYPGEFIQKFDKTLAFIGSSYKLPENACVVSSGNILFSNTVYSNDGGLTWKSYNLLPSVEFVKRDKEGNIYLFYNFQVLISKDLGKSFSKLEFPINVNTAIVKDENTIIICTSNFCFNTEIYLTANRGQSWKKIDSKILPVAFQIKAGIEENLYMQSCTPYIKENEINTWEVYDRLDFGFAQDFENLSNGSILTTNSFNIYIIKDKGKSVKRLDNEFQGLNGGFVEKNGTVISSDFNGAVFSKDFGNTWQSKPINFNPSFESSILGAGFTKDLDLYIPFANNNLEKVKILKYNLVTERSDTFVSPISSALLYRDIGTAFDSDVLYLLTLENRRLYLYSSNNSGQSFSKNYVTEVNNNETIRLKTDHLGNIYVYSESMLLISQDSGISWQNITPSFTQLISINNLNISYDNYIYLATDGLGVLKYKFQLVEPKKLTLHAYQDSNNNCIKEIDEVPLKGIKIVLNGNYVQETDKNGNAIYNLYKKQNKVTIIYNSDLYSVCQDTIDFEFENQSLTKSIDIPIKIIKRCADSKVTMSANFLRRCFDNVYFGRVCNEGSVKSKNTQIVITLDPFFDLKDTNLPIISKTGQQLILDAGDIEVGDCKSFSIKIYLSCDVTLGQEHCVLAETKAGETICTDIYNRNKYNECQKNIGSYDPNDKNIFINGIRNQSYFEVGDKIEYLIRFQNTGTDTAFTVRIEDPLAVKFDILSIKPDAASHEFTWEIKDRTLKVVFPNIMLVDSFTNEPLSHGFVKFEIGLANQAKNGESLSNFAGIYFDFNDPIYTSEVITIIGKPLSTSENESNKFISIIPNPTSGQFKFQSEILSENNNDLYIFDMHGKKVMKGSVNYSENNFDISLLPSGVYIIMIISGNEILKGKLIRL